MNTLNKKELIKLLIAVIGVGYVLYTYSSSITINHKCNFSGCGRVANHCIDNGGKDEWYCDKHWEIYNNITTVIEKLEKENKKEN